ncbi:PAS domain S-box protein [Thiosocius teredinicola]|uniref:PAS domain S-box protein n=1 Tax=Thiosocius teredinicola TaxID=1973002 RepID=UPI000991457B
MMGKPSLRKALLVAALLGLFIPATLFTLYESYVQFDQETERHVRARMAQYSEILKSGIALAIWTADYPYANELAAAVLNDPDVAEVIVEDEFDEIIVALGEDIEQSGSQTSAQFDITFDGRRLGSLRLGITSTNIQQALRNKLLVQGLLLLCQLLLSAILIFLLIERRIVQPLLTLQRSAERVAKGDMSRSLKSTRRDEIGVLYDAFNTMRENLSGLLSAKERSAKELRKSEERFRIISSIANDLIFTGQQLDNGETRLDWMAGDAPGIFGCGVDQVVAEGGFLPFVCTEQRIEFLSAMEKLKPDHPVELQLGIDTIDGRRRTVHFRAELIGTSSARKRPTLYGVVRDITEQIASEKALRLADAVYRNSGQAIAIVDERLRIIAVNPAFTAITGYAFDDVRHRPPGILFSNQRGRELLLAINEAIAQTGRWEGETWHQRKDGEEYAAWLSVDVVRDEDGETSPLRSDVSRHHRKETRRRPYLGASQLRSTHPTPQSPTVRRPSRAGHQSLPTRQLLARRAVHRPRPVQRSQ